MNQLYCRVFTQILDSSLADDWQVRLVFEDMLKLADLDGVVDITHEAFARRTNVPLDIVRRAIVVLESPDPKSRATDEEGRRIIRLDEHRDWGWAIVNWEKFERLRSAADMRAGRAALRAGERARKKARAAAAAAAAAEPPMSVDMSPTCGPHVVHTSPTCRPPSGVGSASASASGSDSDSEGREREGNAAPNVAHKSEPSPKPHKTGPAEAPGADPGGRAANPHIGPKSEPSDNSQPVGLVQKPFQAQGAPDAHPTPKDAPNGRVATALALVGDDETKVLHQIEVVWTEYPKKVGTIEGKLAIRFAIRRDGFPAVLAGTKAIADADRMGRTHPGRFLPKPAEFFETGRYLDDPSFYARFLTREEEAEAERKARQEAKLQRELRATEAFCENILKPRT
jgi:hypothetical protein